MNPADAKRRAAAVERLIKALGGPLKAARLMGVAQATLFTWRGEASRNFPASRAPTAERLSRDHGHIVRCEDLCPDVEWYVLRGPAANDARVTAPEESTADLVA